MGREREEYKIKQKIEVEHLYINYLKYINKQNSNIIPSAFMVKVGGFFLELIEFSPKSGNSSSHPSYSSSLKIMSRILQTKHTVIFMYHVGLYKNKPKFLIKVSIIDRVRSYRTVSKKNKAVEPH